MIHPTAIIDPQATLANDVSIGPYCVIQGPVTIDSGTRLISHVIVMGNTTIGRNNTFWPHSVIGGNPQDLKFKGEDSQLIIGNHNEIREYVTLHRGTANGGNITKIGDHNLLMISVHVGHDCHIGNRIILSNSVQLAGHVHIADHAILSGVCALHSFVSVGAHAYIGGLTRVVRDVPPFMIFEGNPAMVRGVNSIGLTRRGFSEQTITRLKEAYRMLFMSLAEGRPGRTTEQLHALEEKYPDDTDIAFLIDFIHKSSAGLHGRYLEGSRTDNRYANPSL